MKNKLAKVITLALSLAFALTLISCGEIKVSGDDIKYGAWASALTNSSEKGAQIIKSKKELSDFLLSIDPSSAEEALEKYNDAFFEKNVLVAFKLTEGNSGYFRVFDYYKIKENKLTINLLPPNEDKGYLQVLSEFKYVLEIPKEQITEGLKIEIIVDGKTLE